MNMRIVRLLGVLVILLAGVVVASSAPAAADGPYRCRNVDGGASGFIGHITAVRVGQHPSFDRFVVQFREGRVPKFHLKRQSNATFQLEGTGQPVTLRGHAGIEVILNRATGAGSYHGRRDFKPPFVQLREARQLGDFEAVTRWGLGLHRQSCLHAFTLRAPARLVVDVPH
jgi:hypothetical protein